MVHKCTYTQERVLKMKLTIGNSKEYVATCLYSHFSHLLIDNVPLELASRPPSAEAT